eukprot:m.136068 g.136068  ORF g.136068 m.136068 type:complete len:571 (+) comp14722_c0_seq5:1490-3202(+)
MVEVTSENFEESFKLFSGCLQDAAFVSIDLEMTGIQLGAEAAFKRTDSPQDRYKKMKDVASHYSVIQVGLTLFCPKNDATFSFEACPFTFYVFPTERGSSEIRLNGSTVTFLNKHGMDWVKWIRNGVPYVNKNLEEKLNTKLTNFKSKIAEKSKKDTASSPTKNESKAESGDKPPAKRQKVLLNTDSDRLFVNNAIANLQTWLDRDCPEGKYDLPECNGFLRRAMHERLDDLGLGKEFRRETRDRKYIAVFRENEDERAKRDAEMLEAEEKSFVAKCGFRRVFTKLVDSRLPLIGHNLLYDILFVFHSFQGPLPDTLQEFKVQVNALFPCILDTKYISTFRKVKDNKSDFLQEHNFEKGTDLESLYKQLEGDKVMKLKEEFANCYKSENESYHEAGWDSLVTGCCFVQLCKLIYSEEDLSVTDAFLQKVFNDYSYMCFTLFSTFLFNLNAAESEHLSPYMVGEDRVCFVVTGLTKDDKQDSVMALVLPAYTNKSRITWSDDATAFITITELGDQSKFINEENLSGKSIKPIQDWLKSIQAPKEETDTQQGFFSWLAGLVRPQKRKRGQDD